MLRRKPTAITISSEDLAAFEDARLRHKAKENNGQDAEAISDNSKANAFDPNDELKPLPGDKARIVRSREERIGVSRRGWTSEDVQQAAGFSRSTWTFGTIFKSAQRRIRCKSVITLFLPISAGFTVAQIAWYLHNNSYPYRGAFVPEWVIINGSLPGHSDFAVKIKEKSRVSHSKRSRTLKTMSSTKGISTWTGNVRY